MRILIALDLALESRGYQGAQIDENPLVPKNGTITAPDLPGFGMRIKPEIWSHPAAELRTTNLT